VVSDILESNGSSSMASVCGSSLSLMDAGVPIKRPVAGVAMGLIKEGDDYTILSDIAGVEDHLGDMDFKVAGTSEGITALQMDIKITGVTFEIMSDALAQAKEGREFILGKMHDEIPGPREQMSPYAPRIIIIKINPELIRNVIGPGGKVINDIIAKTGVQIEVENDGTVTITSADLNGLEAARKRVEDLTRELKPGEFFPEGKVTRILDFGAFVEVLPGQEGMVHISELSPTRVEKVTDVVKVGDIIPVVVIKIDELGRVNLSLKRAKEKMQQNGGSTGPKTA